MVTNATDQHSVEHFISLVCPRLFFFMISRATRRYKVWRYEAFLHQLECICQG